MIFNTCSIYIWPKAKGASIGNCQLSIAGKHSRRIHNHIIHGDGPYKCSCQFKGEYHDEDEDAQRIEVKRGNKVGVSSLQLSLVNISTTTTTTTTISTSTTSTSTLTSTSTPTSTLDQESRDTYTGLRDMEYVVCV